MTDIDFLLPDVGEGLADAVVSRWIVAEGQPITRMEPMVEVETAKSTVEIPSPVDGVMARHGAAVGETLDVGALLAVLRPAGETGEIAPARGPHRRNESGAGDGRSAPADAEAAAATKRDGLPGRGSVSMVRAAPTVRRRAYREGIDLADVPATGDGGRVLMSDLELHVQHAVMGGAQAGATREAPAAEAATAPDSAGITAAAVGDGRERRGIQQERSHTLHPMRTAIIETLSRAWRQVPLITDLREVDATELARVRPILRDELGSSRLTYTALFCTVVIAALRRHPEFNIWFDADSRTVTYKEHVDLGVAVSVPGGLSVGVVHRAEALTMGDLSASISDIADRARNGRLSLAEMAGATITVTSFGTHGGWFGTPLVIPPQALITGFGAVKDRVVAVDGQAVVRPVVPLSVSADHRVIDGAELSTFCSTVERLIAEPARLAVV